MNAHQKEHFWSERMKNMKKKSRSASNADESLSVDWFSCLFLALTDIMAYQSHKLMKTAAAAAGNNDNNVAYSIKVQPHFEISQL